MYSSNPFWASSLLGPHIFLSTLLPTPSSHALSSKSDTKFHTHNQPVQVHSPKSTERLSM